jgi:hypothetical protein
MYKDQLKELDIIKYLDGDDFAILHGKVMAFRKDSFDLQLSPNVKENSKVEIWVNELEPNTYALIKYYLVGKKVVVQCHAQLENNKTLVIADVVRYEKNGRSIWKK